MLKRKCASSSFDGLLSQATVKLSLEDNSYSYGTNNRQSILINSNYKCKDGKGFIDAKDKLFSSCHHQHHELYQNRPFGDSLPGLVTCASFGDDENVSDRRTQCQERGRPVAQVALLESANRRSLKRQKKCHDFVASYVLTENHKEDKSFKQNNIKSVCEACYPWGFYLDISDEQQHSDDCHILGKLEEDSCQFKQIVG